MTSFHKATARRLRRMSKEGWGPFDDSEVTERLMRMLKVTWKQTYPGVPVTPGGFPVLGPGRIIRIGRPKPTKARKNRKKSGKSNPPPVPPITLDF